MTNLFYTFEITYDCLDDFGSIQFCANTKAEAIQLFNDWCIKDNNLQEPAPSKSVEVVYNEEDAMEYGLKYGKSKLHIS